jgi:hypothetical protein
MTHHFQTKFASFIRKWMAFVSHDKIADGAFAPLKNFPSVDSLKFSPYVSFSPTPPKLSPLTRITGISFATSHCDFYVAPCKTPALSLMPTLPLPGFATSLPPALDFKLPLFSTGHELITTGAGDRSPRTCSEL